MPGKWRYVAGGLLIAAGAIGFVVFLVTRISGFTNSLERIDIPGTRDLDLAAGSYTVYWEFTGLTASVPDFQLSVTSKPTGQGVRLNSSWVNSRYSTGSKRGTSIYGFDIVEPGFYEVGGRCSGPPTTIAVGKAAGLQILVTVLGCLALLGGGLGLGIPLIVITARRRQAF